MLEFLMALCAFTDAGATRRTDLLPPLSCISRHVCYYQDGLDGWLWGGRWIEG